MRAVLYYVPVAAHTTSDLSNAFIRLPSSRMEKKKFQVDKLFPPLTVVSALSPL